MNARELHDLYVESPFMLVVSDEDRVIILRALDLLARTEESTDEMVRELQRMALPDPHDERDVPHAPLCRKAASALVALKAERDSLRAHAEALHDKLGRFLEFFHGYQSMEWKDSHEVYDAYRAAFPKDAP